MRKNGSALNIRTEKRKSSSVIDGSYFKTDIRLKNDIQQNPIKYQSLFHHAANLKILNYLVDCNKLDTTPYQTEYALLDLHHEYEAKGLHQ